VDKWSRFVGMDLNKAIKELHEELEKINQVIASLEHFQNTGTLPVPPHRGRKSMGAAERRLVSERMKRYWAGRRKRSSAG